MNTFRGSLPPVPPPKPASFQKFPQNATPSDQLDPDELDLELDLDDIGGDGGASGGASGTGGEQQKRTQRLQNFGKNVSRASDGTSDAGAVGAGAVDAFALKDYDGANHPRRKGHLSFKTGDLIVVHERPPSGWWKGKCNGTEGIFPSEFCSVDIAPCGTV
jgi:hypothetical protein